MKEKFILLCNKTPILQLIILFVFILSFYLVAANSYIIEYNSIIMETQYSEEHNMYYVKFPKDKLADNHLEGNKWNYESNSKNDALIIKINNDEIWFGLVNYECMQQENQEVILYYNSYRVSLIQKIVDYFGV